MILPKNLTVIDDGLRANLHVAETASVRRDRRFMQLADGVCLTRYCRATGKRPDFCAEPGLHCDFKAGAERLTTGHHRPG